MSEENKTNGAVPDPKLEVLEKQIEQDWQLVEMQDPVAPELKFKFRRAGRAWTYYKSINWVEWWDEFNSAIIAKGQVGAGRRKYRSIWNFICQRTKVSWQRTALYAMIGPAPKDSNVKLDAPYLGDWEKRRRNGFYVFEDDTKIKAVQKAMQERAEFLEATRALAPMIAKRLAYWWKIRDLITEAYAGKVFEDAEDVVSNRSGKRVARFFRWQTLCEEMIGKLEEQWMKVHGVNPQDPAQQWLAMGGQIGAAAALTGVVAAGGTIPGRPTLLQDGQELPLPENVSYDSILMAEQLQQHAKTYNLPLPAEIQKASKMRSKTQ